MPEYILADNGYYGLDQIEYAYSRGVIPIIPDRNDAMKAKGTYSDNPHAKCNMSFDPIKLEFTCLYNQKLKVTGIIEVPDLLSARISSPHLLPAAERHSDAHGWIEHQSEAPQKDVP